MKTPLTILFIILTLNQSSFAQDGTLDPTFGNGGIVTTSTSGYSYGIAIQSDDKIIIAGSSLVRYINDGNLDSSFNYNGIVTDFFNSSGVGILSLAIQKDGKIIGGGGYATGNFWDFALTRYDTNGNLDTLFGNNGIATTDIGPGTDYINSVAIQSDGKIVATGYTLNGAGNSDLAVVRYNSNGTLDTTFSNDGIITTAFGPSSDEGLGIAIQSDGKIVVVGDSYNGSSDDIALVRYNTNGTLDTSFDLDGKLTTSIGTGNDVGRDVAIQDDDKIVISGYSNTFINNLDFAVVRYNSNGSLDNTFNSNGIVTIPVGTSHDYGRSLAIQSDGKIVVAGFSLNGSNNEISLVRLKNDGALDPSFGNEGKTTTAIESESVVGLDVAIQFDGKIVVTGGIQSNSNSLVLRYNNPSLSLPVELTSFSASSSSINIQLFWETASESNNAGWEVERRQQNVAAFQKIGFVPGKGTTTEIQHYQFNDPILSDNVEYRLKQLDTDGKFSYSTVLTVQTASQEFSLSQNYPNPFNPTTSITYQLSTQSHVRLTITDVLGREIVVLVNDEKPIGTYSVNFDASLLSSGLYFYTLQAGNFSETKKLNLLK